MILELRRAQSLLLAEQQYFYGTQIFRIVTNLHIFIEPVQVFLDEEVFREFYHDSPVFHEQSPAEQVINFVLQH